MSHETILLDKIKRLIKYKKYRIRIHAIRHMVEDGFDEEDVVEAIIGKSKIIENYPDDCRCLILCRFHFTDAIISPLHIVCDYPRYESVDIVTAYIPERPWWISPIKRGKKI